jgi:hypothetical protein
MRPLALVIIVAAAAGCGSKSDPCSSYKGTCITATLTSRQIPRVDELDFLASGAVSGPQTSTTTAESFPIAVAIVLPATASGELDLSVNGKLAGSVVGGGSGSTTVTPGQHGTVTIDLEPTGGGEDMAMGGDDLGGPPDDLQGAVAKARLVAPLSTATVTKQTPTLHWALSPGSGMPVVDLCKDRACTMLQAVTAQVAANGLSAVPSGPLPHGWVYWRVRVVNGSTTVSTSPTWQFWVGKLAGAAVDSSSGTVLDVNGDGVADYLVGARDGNAAHVYLGNSSGAAMTRLDLTAPDGASAFFGCAVTSAGDVNGDGFADFLVGAYTAPGSGAVHLYFGSASPSTVDWNGAGAAKRIDIANPTTASGYGFSVSPAGDVNGDGYADFLVATPFATGGGLTWVYFGEAQPAAAHWNGMTASGRIDLTNVDGGGQFGAALAAAGDVNGDGFGDFLVGNITGAGSAHLYMGSATPSAMVWNTTTNARFDLTSPDGANAQFGSVGAGGDVNGDGYSDFLVGSGGAALATHVYLGQALPSTAFWNGTASQRIDVTNPDGTGSTFGATGGFAGDVNGDGYDDFVVGAIGALTAGGEMNLFFGEATPAAAHWNGTTPTKRIDIPGPDGNNANCGASANGAGDVNGDGFTDFLLGCPAATGGGAAHLYLGASAPSATSLASGAKAIANPDGASALFGSSVGPSRTGS